MKQILVIEDDVHVQTLIKDELEDEGYIVHTCSNGKEGLAFLAGEEKPDIIILDLRMPQMDGLDTMGHIVKLRLNIPIIIYTAFSSYKDDALAIAADAYVVKSHDMSELKNKIKELTQRGMK